jgi:hypothetical protein
MPPCAQCMICLEHLVTRPVCVSLTCDPSSVYYWACLDCVRHRLYNFSGTLFHRVKKATCTSGRLYVMMPSPWDPLILMVGSLLRNCSVL